MPRSVSLPSFVRNPLLALWLLPRSVAVALIGLYQATLSPDHGPLKHLWKFGYCRHAPTCSEYGKDIIVCRGVTIGSFLLLRRLLSCHPWAPVSDEKLREAATRNFET